MQTIYTPLRAKNHGRLVNQKGCFLSCLMRITTILFCFHFLVSFWQPLTELPEKKCKRCGLYEEDTFKHDLYDEWELCSSDFKKGKYTHFKEGQFNATFLCPNCTASAGDSANHDSSSEVETKKSSVTVIIIVSVLSSVLVIIALFGGYKYWLKKKRERDQLRFLKLFEEGDDIEDELGLGNEL
jgi:hypothetical protein